MTTLDTILKPRITVEHMALARGWIQGLELSDLAIRYLAGLGDDDGAIDMRSAKGTLIRVLDDLGTTAKRNAIMGGVTLKRQASRIRIDPDAPTLEDFADTLESPDFYCEAELAQLYTQRYSKSLNAGARGLARRSRLIERQLQLITELQHHVCAPMSRQDTLALWFEETLTARLVKAGIDTVETLCIAIVKKPDRWFESVKGIGQSKAERIRRFLLAQRGPLDESMGIAGMQFKAPQGTGISFRASLTAGAPPCLGLDQTSFAEGPTSRLWARSANAKLDGSQGSLRAQAGPSATSANNDLQAIETWLNLKASPKTVALYRRELERVLLFAIRELRKPLSSFTIEDALNYRAFLQNVPDTWISKKGTRQLTEDVSATLTTGARPLAPNPDWSPFAGSLSVSSVKKALVIIQNFFRWTVAANYCAANPFAGVKVHATLASPARTSTRANNHTSNEYARNKEAAEVRRTLTLPTIDAIEQVFVTGDQDDFLIRAKFIFRLACMTGLRISEIAAARRDQMKYMEATPFDGGGWALNVVGKRSKLREVPLPAALIKDLEIYTESRGLPGTLQGLEPGVFLVGKLPSLSHANTDQPTIKDKVALRTHHAGDGVRPQTIHRSLGELFGRAAQLVEAADMQAAQRLRQASAHWLRHTCATHAVAADVPLDVVMSTLGHASLTTTSRYIHTESRRKLREMEKFWSQESDLP
jgi:integrase